MPAKLKLEGQKFGKLTVLSLHHTDKMMGTFWICQCKCGDTVNYRGSVLRRGEAKTCGKKKCRTIDLTNRVYGRWTVIDFDHQRSAEDSEAYWLCRCSCGREKSIRGSALNSGNSLSCRCRSIEISKEFNSLPKGVASFNTIFYRYQKEAAERNFSWDLNEEQFKHITQSNCYYCGIEPRNSSKCSSPNGIYIYNGIDRVDNSKGYFLGNVVPCCKMCNRVKYKESEGTFLSYIERVYNFQHSKTS